MSSPPHPSPGLTLHELSFLVEKFEENRTNWNSSHEYGSGLAKIIANITPSYGFAVLEALEAEGQSFTSRFQDAHDPQQVRDLFRELYEASGCPFLAEDQKMMISQSKVTKFTTDLMASRSKLHFDKASISAILRLAIDKALTRIGISGTLQEVLENAVQNLITDFRCGFSKGDITDATKTLFETLGYQIRETSPDEEKRNFHWQKMQVLSNSMAAPFQGKSAQALFNFITTCQGKFIKAQPHSMRFYAKFISVCNSSGTGKTKTILQLRDLGVCVVYINMRPVSDSENFPPRDDAIALLFEGAMKDSPEPEPFEKRSIMIFRALFQHLKTEFEQFAHTPGLSAKEVVRAWNETYTENLKTDNSMRTSFFSSVSEDYYKLCKDTAEKSIEECRGLLVKDHSTLLALPCFRDSKQFLVISLDEVQGLTEANPKYLPSHILGQVIKLFSTHEVKTLSIWVIFTSTNSRIVHFAAPAHMHASQRIVTHGEQLFPPFNYLQLDIFAKPMEELDIFSVGSYEDVIRCGRPLWESVKYVYDNPETMSDFAGVKLMGMSTKDDPAYLLAALSQRFSLQVLMGSRDAVTYLEDSIASHMRYVLNTHDDRSWQFTRYPSEPVLSNAAAQILYGEEQRLSTAIDALATKIGLRVIDAGEYGELISRLLLLISRDVTAIRAYDIAPACTLHNFHPKNLSFEKFPLRKDKDYFDYLRPVAVLDVLDTLFGPDWTKDKNDKDQREKIKRDFANAFVSASHWITMTNDVGSRPENMEADYCLKTLYLTGVALQCVHGQPLIDKVIPIMFLNKEKNDCVGWSALFIQDKNRQTGNGNALHKIDPSDPTIKLATTKPYIAICFEFGIPTSKPTTSTAPTRSSTRTERANNWIRIQATGLDSEVFPVLNARTAFARSLINLRDIDRDVKKANDPIEQYILATAQFATSGSHFLRGPDIPFKGGKDEDVEMTEESDTPLVETLGGSGHGELKRKRSLSSSHDLEPEDVAMEDSNEASGSQEQST